MAGFVYLICGKICSGKTTYSRMLAKAKKAVILSTDDITLALFDQHLGDKHDEVVASVQKYLLGKSLEILGSGVDVILDWGFWTRASREYVREYFSSRGIGFEFHYIDVSYDQWTENITKRNHEVADGRTSAYFIDDHLAKKFEGIFEEPERSEIDVWYTLDTHSGSPAPELWDLYDKHRSLTGRTMIRGETVPEGLYHLTVDVWITDGRGKYLISRRALNRPIFAGMYETAGGSCLIGETSLQGAMREAYEELGVDLSDCRGRLLYIKKRGDNFKDAWLFEYKGEIDLSKATTDEVMELSWMTPDEIRLLFEQGKFVEPLKYFFTDIDGISVCDPFCYPDYKPPRMRNY